MGKIDFAKLLEQLANNEQVRQLTEAAINKIVDMSKNGLPWRKEISRQLAEQAVKISVLEDTVKALLQDKIDSETKPKKAKDGTAQDSE